MKVKTHITRSDLLRFNYKLLFKLKSTYRTLIFLWLSSFVFFVYLNGMPTSIINWLATIVGAFGGAIIAMLFGFIINMLNIILSSTISTGSIGEHEYELRDEGLYEKTNVNEGLTKWEGIEDIIIIDYFILFKISKYLYHIIPKRSFASKKEFDSFAVIATKKWKLKK